MFRQVLENLPTFGRHQPHVSVTHSSIVRQAWPENLTRDKVVRPHHILKD